jgi:DNA-binding CsgD family transcriptional regulator
MSDQLNTLVALALDAGGWNLPPLERRGDSWNAGPLVIWHAGAGLSGPHWHAELWVGGPAPPRGARSQAGARVLAGSGAGATSPEGALDQLRETAGKGIEATMTDLEAAIQVLPGAPTEDRLHLALRLLRPPLDDLGLTLEDGAALVGQLAADLRAALGARRGPSAADRGVARGCATVLAREQLVLEGLARRCESRPADDDPLDRYNRLTPRQIEVLEQIAKGLSDDEIGAHLGTNANTVAIHRGRIMAQMGFGSTPDLVRWLGAHGLAGTREERR